MMIGPAPMMRTEWMSVRLGMKAGRLKAIFPGLSVHFCRQSNIPAVTNPRALRFFAVMKARFVLVTKRDFETNRLHKLRQRGRTGAKLNFRKGRPGAWQA